MRSGSGTGPPPASSSARSARRASTGTSQRPASSGSAARTAAAAASTAERREPSGSAGQRNRSAGAPSGRSADRGAAGGAAITPASASSSQVAGGRPRRLLGRPERAGQQQPVPGAGDGDVGEPALLGEQGRGHGGLVRAELGLQLGAIGQRAPREDRQLGRVAAELPRHHAGREPAAGALRLRRQLVRDHPRHRDEVPLEPLRAVHRQHLHGAGLGRLAARRQVLLLLGGGEPAEEPAEGGALGHLQVAGEGLVERVQRGEPGTALVGEHLDVEVERLDHEVHEVAEVAPGADAQLGEGAPGAAEPVEAVGAEGGLHPVALVVRQEVEGVDDGCALPLRDRPAEQLGHLGAEALLGEVPLLEPPGEPLQPGEVRGADAPRRAGEQADELRTRAGVVHDAERADEVRHLGLLQQAPDAEHVVRHPVTPERGEEGRQGAPGAEQHGGGRRGAGVLEAGGEPRGDGVRLLVERLGEDGVHRVPARGGRRPQLRHVDPGRGGERGGDRVRRIEHRGAVAPARAEREGRAPRVPPPKSRAKPSRFAADAPRHP